MVVAAHDELRSRGQTRPTLPPGRPADLDAARAELDRACSAFAAELAGAGAGAAVDAAREALTVCRGALEAGATVHPKGAKVGRNANALKTPAADAYRAALRGSRRGRCADRLAVPALALVDELLGRYADAYAAAKRARGGVDFDDLELLARDLLAREPGIAAGYRERFERIMVDEFQDTNALQLELLELVARDNACTVGDELQAIYAFRHADVEVFRARRARLEAAGRTATLATNFRSRPEILRALNGAFGSMHEHWVDLRPGRDDAPGARAGGRAAGHRRRRLERRRAGLAGPRAAGRQRGQAGRGAARGPARRRARARGGRRAARRSSCCCARRPRWASTSARWSWPGCPRWRPAAADGGGASRSATCATCSPPWPTRATRRRCSGCWPRRWPACPPTPWPCSRSGPARAP